MHCQCSAGRALPSIWARQGVETNGLEPSWRIIMGTRRRRYWHGPEEGGAGFARGGKVGASREGGGA